MENSNRPKAIRPVGTNNPASSARRTKPDDGVKELKERGPIKLLGPDPVVQPWGERWRGRPDELETLFVLHYTAKSVAQSFFDGITDRQADWACRLRGLFDLSQEWDALLLLWFSIQYSELERNGEDLGYKGEEFYDENFDRYLLEWTGRFPLRYPEQESIPEEVTIKEWVISYFKAVSEGRQFFWTI